MTYDAALAVRRTRRVMWDRGSGSRTTGGRASQLSAHNMPPGAGRRGRHAPAFLCTGHTMITIDHHRTPTDLVPHVDRLFELSAAKIEALDRRWDQASGAPVFTVEGK